MGMWFDISFAEVVVDVGGSSTVKCYLIEGLICQYAPATQNFSFESLIGHQKCDTVKVAFTSPRYTRVIPATYAGPD